MSKQKDLIKNTFIIAFGKLMTQFVTFLLLPLYTAYLTTSEFGTVDLILTYVVLLAPILTIQLEMAAFRHLIDARNDEVRKRAVISAVMQMVGRALLIFAVIFVAVASVIDIPYAGLIFGAIVAAIPAGLFMQFARGFGDNIKFSIGGVVIGVTTILANIALIVGLDMGARGMLAAIILGNVAGSIYLFIALRLHRYISFTGGDKELRRRLLGYSAPLVPNGIAWWAISAADRTIIALFLGVASNGIFAVAYRFPLIFTGLFSFFGMSWTESASVHIDSKDRDRFFSQTMNASVRLFGALCAGIIAAVPLVFGVLINESFQEAYKYIPILMVGAFLNSIVGLYSAIYIAKKMTKQVASTSIIAAIISVGFTLAFTNYIGLYAAAFAMPIAFLAMAVYRHYDMKKYVTITYQKNIFLKLGILFTFTITLYYMNTFVGNIVNILVVTVAAIMLNKSVVRIIKDKIISFRHRKNSNLTPDQRVEEELNGLQ